MSEIVVRAATAADAAGMARVHVRAWQETYRGQASDEVLDAPDAVARREAMWGRALETPPERAGRISVAVAVPGPRTGSEVGAEADADAEAGADGEIVGIAWAGPARGEDPPAESELYVLYLLAAHHGSGAGQALLDEVLGGAASASLWVADPNPRAQAFYRRNGFAPDGASEPFGSAREIRMVRPAG
jgi:ribosomal protein S18 acetylase RimI-like enzyme